jgi:hypothetical protein
MKSHEDTKSRRTHEENSVQNNFVRLRVLRDFVAGKVTR